MKHVTQKNKVKKNRFIRILMALLVVFLVTSCAKEKTYKENMAVAEVAINESHKAIAEDKKLETLEIKKQNLKIIRSASVKYQVKDVKGITKKINNLVTLQNGYISDLRFSNNLYKKENRFTIKIPQNNFDVIMDSISKFAEFIDFENITSKDVTEEYIDIQTRLKTKIEIKQRYETILRKRAKTVEEILATEEKLRVIQEEIEAAQGKLQYVTNKVSLSTIEVNLYETVNYKEEPVSYTKTFSNKIKNGFSYGWKLIENIIIGITYIWPLLLIGIVVLFYIQRKKK